MIKVLLVDDQKILLEGLAKILAPLPDIEVIGTCTLSELAEEACLRLRPDLVLMDICMEGRTSGIQICERLKATFPSLRIILMTGMQEIAFLDWAKEAGANSFIYKESRARHSPPVSAPRWKAHKSIRISAAPPPLDARTPS